MNTQLKIALAVVAFAATATVAAAAQPRAGHSDYLAGLTQRSLKQPFRADALPLVDVVQGKGREQAVRALLALFESESGRSLAAGAMTRQADDDKITTYAGERGYFEVAGDGSLLRFRADIDDAGRERVAAGERLSKRELESLGRRFVGGTLAPFVTLGEKEKLTYLGARYLYESDGPAERDAAAQERARVVASIAIFGREIDGVPVVGSGSKVAVWFDGAKRPVGFDVDWPIYRIAESRQRLLSGDELRRRVAATTVAPEGERMIAVDRFECGYVDLGATRRDARLQAGCSIAYRGTGKDETWARIDFVPAGAEVLKERRWPLANAVAAGDTVKVGSEGYSRYLDEAEPPADPPPEKAEPSAD